MKKPFGSLVSVRFVCVSHGSTHAQCSPVLRQFRLRKFRANIHIDSKSGVRSAAEMASGGDNEGCPELAEAHRVVQIQCVGTFWISCYLR